MCGIYGILAKTPNQNIKQHITSALNLLKNRGYDSCGVYMNNNKENLTIKYGIDDIKSGEDIFDLLNESLEKHDTQNYYRGIGHTRWATHGKKTTVNSHPHTSQDGRYIIVHNGIISNYNSLKTTYLKDYVFATSTDTEVIANMIHYYSTSTNNMMTILEKLDTTLEGTWACIIIDQLNKDRLYFMKNHSPLLIGENKNQIIMTSEQTGFMNLVESYTLLREHCYGYFDINGNRLIVGPHKEIPLVKFVDNDIDKGQYVHWMRKEIDDQINLSVITDPVTGNKRYSQDKVELNLEWIKPTKYLYIIGCGSSYYSSLIASNYFRYTKAFEFVNVFDGAEFGTEHLNAIANPEDDLLVILITQSGETRDLNLATTICRDFSKKKNSDKKIKILGIVNVVGSLISRRTNDNIYTNCGRENAVASTKSCTSQILACLLCALYKSQICGTLDDAIGKKFLGNLNQLSSDIQETLSLDSKIKQVAQQILKIGHKSMFILGKEELHGVALEGALKIKEIAYIHAEGFHIASLKHGPYALINDNIPVILLYKENNHFIKSVTEELLTRNAHIIKISADVDTNDTNSIKIPNNPSFNGILSVIVLQLLSYHLSVLQDINPDRPRNLAKVVTVD